MRSLRILGLAALVVGAANCGGGGGDTPPPVPGYLTLTLSTPNSNDGAVLFKIQGGTVDSMVAGAMVQQGSYVINPTFTRAVVAGNIVDGIIAKIHVPDVGKVASYTVAVEQVANRTSFAQQNLTNYSIAVTQ